MGKGSKRRLDTLRALNGWMTIEMSGLRREQRQTDQRLWNFEQRVKAIDAEISEAESRARTALDAGAVLVIEEYRMLQAYLDHKQRTRVNNERQRGFARERLVKIENKITRQELKLRGMENLLQRKFKELQIEMEHKQQSLMDEAWLLRRGDGA